MGNAKERTLGASMAGTVGKEAALTSTSPGLQTVLNYGDQSQATC